MKKRNIFLLLALTLIVLYFTLKDNFNEIISSLLNINLIWLLVSYLLVLSYTFLKSLVTNNLVNKLKKLEFSKTFLIQMITFFFNAITPFSSGGQPFQVYMFKKSGLKLVDSTNVVVEETIIHQISLVFLGIITIIINKILGICELNGFLYILLVSGILVNLFIIILLFVLSNSKKINKFLINILIKIISIFKKNAQEKIKDKIYNSLEKFNENSKILLKNKKRFIILILTNTIALICLYLVPLTLLFSLGRFYDFDGIVSIVIISFTSIISSYVPLPGGTIGQEYVFSTLFSSYISGSILSTLLILWRFTTYYLPLLIGSIILNIKQKEFISKKS